MRISVVFSSIDLCTKPILDASEYIIFAPKEYVKEEIDRAIKAFGDKFALFLPVLARSEDTKVLQNLIIECGITRVFSNNLYGLELGACGEIFLGYGHNILNRDFFKSPLFFSEQNREGEYRVCAFMQSLESPRLMPNAYAYAYGYVPLMNLAHCPFKNALKRNCAFCREDGAKYVDERGSKFSISRYKIKNCYFELLNSTPAYTENAKNALLDFRHCNKEEVNRVFEAFKYSKPLKIKSTKLLLNKSLK